MLGFTLTKSKQCFFFFDLNDLCFVYIISLDMIKHLYPPEAKVKAVVRGHLHWLISGPYNVWTKKRIL